VIENKYVNKKLKTGEVGGISVIRAHVTGQHIYFSPYDNLTNHFHYLFP
jgi:hypothetical protein